METSDLHFDILEVMRWEHVARLPRRKRREAFLELARRVAKDFLRTAETHGLGDEDPSSSSESEASSREEPAIKLRRLS